jgi:hypothetical protein
LADYYDFQEQTEGTKRESGLGKNRMQQLTTWVCVPGRVLSEAILLLLGLWLLGLWDLRNLWV